VGSGPQLTLADWHAALLDVLLPVGVNTGRPVLLACDDEAVRAAANHLGARTLDPAHAFIDCLQGAQPITATKGFAAALRAGAQFARAPRPRHDPPPQFAALCACVLAASRMDYTGEHTAGLYYPLLGELLDVPLQADWLHIPGIDALIGTFDDVADWLRHDQGGLRGDLQLPSSPGRRVVGRLVGQTLLRGRDRGMLGDFFWRYGRGLDAGWNPARLARGWGGRHRLTLPAQERVADRRLDRLLSAALRAAYRAWDGTRIDELGRRIWPVRLRLGANPRTIALHASVPGHEGPVHITGPDGAPFELAAHPQETVIPLSWLGDATDGPLRCQAAGGLVEVLDSRTMLFELSDIGLQGVALAGDQPVWALTCDPRLTGLSLPLARRHHAALPAAWSLLVNLTADELPEDLRAPDADPDPASDNDMDLIGGLALGLRTWLVDHPPALRSNLPEPALLRIDEREHGDLDPGEIRTLATIAPIPGTRRLDVGDVWEFELELAERGRREQIGTLRWDLGHPTLARHGAQDGTGPLAGVGPTICGPLVDGTPLDWRPPLLVRAQATVHTLHADGSVRVHAPLSAPAWARAARLMAAAPRGPSSEPWEIPDDGTIVWMCIEHPRHPRAIAVRDLPLSPTDDVLDVADQFAAAAVVARTGVNETGATERWQALVAAATEEFIDG
jgi:hypothetical protein